MSRRLDEILTNINSDIAGALAYPKVKYWNQADLQVKDDKTFPLVNNGNSKGFQISPNGIEALQCYHRIISSVTETDPTKGKGRFPYKVHIYTIKNVWIGTLKRLPSKVYESNDDVRSDVYKAFPTILNQKEIIITKDENVDKNEIMSTEFAGNDMKQLSLELILFSIDYEIRQNIRCN